MLKVVTLFLILSQTAAIANSPDFDSPPTSTNKSSLSSSLTQVILDNNIKQIKVLLQQGLDPNMLIDTELAVENQEEPEGIEELKNYSFFHESTTALMLASASLQDNGVVMQLLKAGANPNATDEVGRTALLLNAMCNGSTSNATTLLKKGADVNASMNNGLTSLFSACMNSRSPEFIKLLLVHGANPNTSALNGSTPLIEAAKEYQDLEVIDLLLKHGADINAETFNGSTAFSQACAWNDSIKVIDRLYIAGGGENRRLNELGYSRTPIMSVAIDGSPEVLQYLIEIGADVNLSDDRGNTALMLASKWNTPEIVKRLLEAGADLEARDNQGATALLLSCKYNDARMISTLLSAGAEPRATDFEGFGYEEYLELYKNEQEVKSLTDLIKDELIPLP